MTTIERAKIFIENTLGFFDKENELLAERFAEFADAETGRLRRTVEILEKAARHYADEFIWSERSTEPDWGKFCYMGKGNGYDIAATALAEIEDAR